MKKFLCIATAIVMALSVAGCSSNTTTTTQDTSNNDAENAETSTVTVYAAASMTETLNQIGRNV